MNPSVERRRPRAVRNNGYLFYPLPYLPGFGSLGRGRPDGTGTITVLFCNVAVARGGSNEEPVRASSLPGVRVRGANSSSSYRLCVLRPVADATGGPRGSRSVGFHDVKRPVWARKRLGTDRYRTVTPKFSGGERSPEPRYSGTLVPVNNIIRNERRRSCPRLWRGKTTGIARQICTPLDVSPDDASRVNIESRLVRV